MAQYDVDDNRHYKNQYSGYSSEIATHFISQSNLVPSFRDFIIKKIYQFVTLLDDQIEELSSRDVSVYTGLSGIALFYYHLSNSKVEELQGLAKKARTQAERLIKRSLSSLRNRQGSFLCDDTGPITLSVLLNNELSDLDRVIQIGEYVINSSDMPDEMLYGRSGYLYALLLLNKHKHQVPHKLIKKVFKTIIYSGLKLSKKRNEKGSLPPLYYEWHNKAYLGAAHGIAGIMFMLLQVYLDDDLLDIREDIRADISDYVKPTINYLYSLRLTSGNYPSSIGESADRDVLVHWCHGAPGWIYMFIAASKVFKERIYMERVKEIAEVIWVRGLLEKGCGICHGTAGNGYALMAIYRHTGQEVYFYRAVKFAEWCTDYFRNRNREADRPYSLFEGLAGTLNYLVDCLDPIHSKFPAFEL